MPAKLRYWGEYRLKRNGTLEPLKDGERLAPARQIDPVDDEYREPERIRGRRGREVRAILLKVIKSRKRN